jgi:hypothetical protein
MKNLAPLYLILIVFLYSCTQAPLKIQIETDSDSPQVSFALQQLEAAVRGQGIQYPGSQLNITTSIDATNLKSEAFSIKNIDGKITLTGGDNVGLMYGLLEMKEQLLNGYPEIEARQSAPRLPFRAIKFNLPWASYRNSEALSLHRETCRDLDFWEAFLDMMAENRFNALTLWSQHPFSYMVKLEKYPEACSLNDAELVEWQAFWRRLFAMAKDRGIETYLINWNIFVSPEFARAYGAAEYSIDNEYFIAQGDTSELVKDFTRECVREVIDQYPDLTGLGIGLGEGMGGMTPVERELWLHEAYIAGMRQAGRKIKFIHRVPFSANTQSGGSASSFVEKMTRETLDTLTVSELPVYSELKFNWSHAHSTPHLAKVHGGELTDAYWNPVPENYRLAWMMRNEDFFMLRWGQPDFIRKHIAANAHSYVNGYYVGSECYIPAKDYITSLPGASYRYAFERQWMYYKNWGRLLYNPLESDLIFESEFVRRFPDYGKKLFLAQQSVSKVPLILASYWNATWDFTLYSEGMLTLHNDRMTVFPMEELCSKTPMEPKYMGIGEFLKSNGAVAEKITPHQLADSLETFCMEAIDDMKPIDTKGNVDLLYEVSDIRTWANLGICFANRLRAGVEFQRYIENGEMAHKTKAIELLEQSLENWKEVVRITKPVYKPVPLVHNNHNDNALFHWSVFQKDIEEEIKRLKGGEM